MWISGTATKSSSEMDDAYGNEDAEWASVIDKAVVTLEL